MKKCWWMGAYTPGATSSPHGGTVAPSTAPFEMIPVIFTVSSSEPSWWKLQ